MNRLREEKTEEAPDAQASGTKTATKKKGSAAKLPRALIGVLNGSFLTKEKVLGNMPFILFCAGLMLCYIAYGYHTERIVRDLEHTGAVLKEQRAEYLTVRAELEKQEQQSQVAGRIEDIGLRESRVPPVKLEVDEDELNDTRTP
ncbi:MAG TPA: FtsL-like putative cell division protein [Flavobacteriales bacterium]|nr:FtsL-like putative cell division protein [Flavobacteriales bacterium]